MTTPHARSPELEHPLAVVRLAAELALLILELELLHLLSRDCREGSGRVRGQRQGSSGDWTYSMRMHSKAWRSDARPA